MAFDEKYFEVGGIGVTNAQPVRRSLGAVPFWSIFIVAMFVLVGLVAAYMTFDKQLYSYTITIPEAQMATTTFEYGAAPRFSDRDYYNNVRQGFIDQKTNFIEADLSGMLLRVYQDGQVALEVPIKTKGREGSWWETPAGLYKIEGKERDHFSSMGKVHQPWSMIFQGNFFIHGWPYYPDGTPVATTYSGGCIRLATEDAEAVYKLSAQGMPVLVYEQPQPIDDFHYIPKGPQIKAEKYLIADVESNTMLMGQGVDDVMPIASITKLITGLVTVEYLNLDKEITITASMLASTSKARLYEGQKISVYNLLFPLLMESSNEAAEAVARTLGRGRFVSLMNQKAQAINLPKSQFVDPSGAGAGNVSTARDLFTLVQYLLSNRNFIFKMTAGDISTSAYGDRLYTNLGNYNKVPGTSEMDAQFIGGKIGKTTAAGETYVGVYKVMVAGKERSIAVILLHSPDVYADVRTVLEYIRMTY